MCKIKENGETKKAPPKKRVLHGGNDPNHVNRKTYVTWASMLQRCEYIHHKSYAVYGGAGITVCKEWKSFVKFLSDMGIRPKGCTLGRIDHAKGYFKENSRWETYKEQANNRRNSRIVEYGGIERTLSQWSEILFIRRDTLHLRIKSGWSIEKSFTKPVGMQGKKHDGQNN